MLLYPVQYDEPLFRPPSEARSLIIQITLGCSWTNCAFCEMYTEKKFRARSEADIFNDIDAFIPYSNTAMTSAGVSPSSSNLCSPAFCMRLSFLGGFIEPPMVCPAQAILWQRFLRPGLRARS